jgi:uncharacterized repeat protein (TIGR01451 family)
VRGVKKFGCLVAAMAGAVAISHAAPHSYVRSANIAARQSIGQVLGRIPSAQLCPPVPLSFEPNEGQTNPRVKFLAHGLDYDFFLVPDETVLMLRQVSGRPVAGALLSSSRETDRMQTIAASLRLKLVGANPNVEITGIDKIPAISNYFIGNDPKEWHAGVPHYAKVRYRSIYPGIDVVYYGHRAALEYDFVIGPEADPTNIVLQIMGTEALSLDSEGNLTMAIAAGEVRLHQPHIYQEQNGRREPVAGHYRLMGGQRVGFALAKYDTHRPITIDPVLTFSTYIGGASRDAGLAVASHAGSLYVAGQTGSPDFPVENALQASRGSNTYDAFVSKLSPDGDSLVYSTYLGGSGSDWARGIAIDSDGNVYLTGNTNSSDFPTSNPLQATYGGPGGIYSYPDAFVTKLGPMGDVLVYSTYLGGNQSDLANSIAVDAAGNAYITGSSTSSNMPGAANCFSAAQYPHAYVAELTSAGSALVYATCLGSGSVGTGYGIALNGDANAYVVWAGYGFTHIEKLDSRGQTLYAYSPDNGGSTEGRAIAVDAAGGAYVTGYTETSAFPTLHPIQATFGGQRDAFVLGLSAAGALDFSTYLGGSQQDEGHGIALDATGNVYVTGITSSSDYPTVQSFQSALAGGRDTFVARLSPNGSVLLMSSYLGGSGDDDGNAIAVDNNGAIYVTGETASGDFPRTHALENQLHGPTDAFIVRIADTASSLADLSLSQSGSADPVVAGTALTYTLTLVNNGPNEAINVVLTDALPPGVTFDSIATSGICSGTETLVCTLGMLANGDSATVKITVTPQTWGSLWNATSAASDVADPNMNDNSASVLTTVAPAPGTLADLAIDSTSSPNPAQAGEQLAYTITVTNNGPTEAFDTLALDSIAYLDEGFSVVPSQGNCSGTEPITCTLGTLANGATATIAVIGTVPSLFVGPVTNTAQVRSGANDPDTTNNQTVLATNVVPPLPPPGPQADLGVRVSAVSGGTPVYKFTVTNAGPASATNVTLTSYSSEMTLAAFQSATASQGYCWTDLNLCGGFQCLSVLGEPLHVTCNLGTVSPETTVTGTVKVAVLEGTWHTAFSVSSDVADPDGSNNSTTAASTVNPVSPSGGGGGGGGGCTIRDDVYNDPVWLVVILGCVVGGAWRRRINY